MTVPIQTIKWLILLIVIGVSIHVIKNFDLATTELRGDEASYVFQTLSIAHDLDLKFDKNDEQSWKKLGWKENPNGLYFQKYSDGFAFAKPYAYSLFNSVYVAAFGAKGFIVGNIVILILLNVFIYLALIKQYSEGISVGLTLAFTFFSYVYFYAFIIHADLFLALLVAVYCYVLASLQTQGKRHLIYILPALLAFILADKITMLLALLPLTIYQIRGWPRKDIGLFVAIFCLCFFTFSLPYLYYSDYHSWNPYAGDRFHSRTSVPFFESSDAGGFVKVGSEKYFKLDFLRNNLLSIGAAGLKTSLLSLYYYFFGSFTGVLIFQPISFVAIASSTFAVIKRLDARLMCTLIGLALYILFYVVLFPSNYYGGFGSLGNRYFLQASPLIILLLLYLRLGKRQAIMTICLSLLLSVVFIHQHHADPSNAYVNRLKTSAAQRMMPMEKTLSWLGSKIPYYQKVNLGLLPSKPGYFRAPLYYQRDKRSVIYNASRDVLIQNTKRFLKVGALAFHKIRLNKNELFVGGGFYQMKGKFRWSNIWSDKESQLLIRNKGQLVKLVLQSYVPMNEVRITVDGTAHKIELNKAGSLAIDLNSINRNWVLVKFSADKAAQPSALHPSNKDNRDLSFNLRIVEEPSAARQSH